MSVVGMHRFGEGGQPREREREALILSNSVLLAHMFRLKLADRTSLITAGQLYRTLFPWAVAFHGPELRMCEACNWLGNGFTVEVLRFPKVSLSELQVQR